MTGGRQFSDQGLLLTGILPAVLGIQSVVENMVDERWQQIVPKIFHIRIFISIGNTKENASESALGLLTLIGQLAIPVVALFDTLITVSVDSSARPRLSCSSSFRQAWTSIPDCPVCLQSFDFKPKMPLMRMWLFRPRLSFTRGKATQS